MTLELFDPLPTGCGTRSPEALADGASLLRGFACREEAALLAALETLLVGSGFRRMCTPGGRMMSIEITNCGALGWVSDRSGYRYAARDPDSGQAWPAMPQRFRQLAIEAAALCGFPGFEPDACLINRYTPGARLSLHQDRNERDFSAPIVSVSLGLPAIFLFGGLARTDPARRIPLHHGDVAVWGGPARLRFHGVLPLKPGEHCLLGAQRINLTFRKAG
jgi:alkylated DNA repair protein (DNA oxidative demethylase)